MAEIDFYNPTDDGTTVLEILLGMPNEIFTLLGNAGYKFISYKG